MRSYYTMFKPGRRYNMNTAHRGLNPFYLYKPSKAWNRPLNAVSVPVEVFSLVLSFWKALLRRVKAFFVSFKNLLQYVRVHF